MRRINKCRNRGWLRRIYQQFLPSYQRKIGMYCLAYEKSSGESMPESLLEAIQELPAYCQILDSLWVVETPETTEGLYKTLVRNFNNSDSIVIFQIGDEACHWLRDNTKAEGWLRAHMNSAAVG